MRCWPSERLPADGEIVYMGHRQGRDREVEALVRHGMTLVPEKRELFAEMSVEDNLLLGAFDRYRTGHRDQMETMDEVFELFPRLDLAVGDTEVFDVEDDLVVMQVGRGDVHAYSTPPR